MGIGSTPSPRTKPAQEGDYGSSLGSLLCIDLQTSKPRASGVPNAQTLTSQRASNHRPRKSDPSGIGEDSDVDPDFLPDSRTPTATQLFGTTGKGPGVSTALATRRTLPSSNNHYNQQYTLTLNPRTSEFAFVVCTASRTPCDHRAGTVHRTQV